MSPDGTNPASRALERAGYRLLEKIGEGGMGEVYRAQQLAPRREVAIKLLHAGRPAFGSRRFSLRREFRLMASLSHPHVVAVYDRGRAAGRHFLAMEYVAGPALRALHPAGRPWPLHDVAALIAALASALGYIHARGFLHLDLKPENVLLQRTEGETERGGDKETGRQGNREIDLVSLSPRPSGSLAKLVPKIADFGLALPRDAGLQTRDDAQGTSDYCSPEQRYGLPVDARSDLFALATLTYELVAGRLPGRVYRPVASSQPDLPPALDLTLARALTRDPAGRHGSVADFYEEFARWTRETTCRCST